MTAEEAIKRALESVGVPVKRLLYRGDAQTFITYQLVISAERDFSDDKNETEEFTYRVDLYSRSDYIAVLRRMKRALKEAGFYSISAAAELYENDTKFFHVPVTVKYLEEAEAVE